MTEIKEQTYLPLLEIFEQKRYRLSKIYDFNDGWMIYERKHLVNKTQLYYELVKPKKNNSYELGGVKIEARVSYPSENLFGSTGFSCMSIDHCKSLHSEIINNKNEKI